MKPELFCYYHPECEASGQCDRCGDYLCSECIRDTAEMQLCSRCLQDMRPRVPLSNSLKASSALNALGMGSVAVLAKMDSLVVMAMIVSVFGAALVTALVAAVGNVKKVRSGPVRSQGVVGTMTANIILSAFHVFVGVACIMFFPAPIEAMLGMSFWWLPHFGFLFAAALADLVSRPASVWPALLSCLALSVHIAVGIYLACNPVLLV